MSLIHATLSQADVSAAKKTEVLHRIWSDPGIPQQKTTTSFWMQDPIQLADSSLPSEADVVIIGSGISGMSVAQALLQNLPHVSNASSRRPKVVMLDARAICSGATGRNGGHMLETAEEYAELKEYIGKDAAAKVIRFRLAHLNALVEEATKVGLLESSQCRRVRFLSCYFSEEKWQHAKTNLEVFRKDMPLEAVGFEAEEGVVAQKKYDIRKVAGILSGPAGAMWPYKFCTGLLASLQTQYGDDFNVVENNPVLEIVGLQDGEGLQVITSKGPIRAKHVVHCTNGHASHLIPGLRGHLFPLRGQMSAQIPGPNFGDRGSQNSWLLSYDYGFDYITQLPVGGGSSGEIMAGGGFANCPGKGIDQIGDPLDDDMSVYVDIHLSGVIPAVFGGEDKRSGNGTAVKDMWSGTMGFTADGFPWVGKLLSSLTGRKDKKSAEWICGGFSGEGMVNAWLSGKAMAAKLLLQEGVKLDSSLVTAMEALPDQMHVSEERIKRSELPRKYVNGESKNY